jgi:DMSO/TMAO reductase YedYZ heme-binding membrane subunit
MLSLILVFMAMIAMVPMDTGFVVLLLSASILILVYDIKQLYKYRLFIYIVVWIISILGYIFYSEPIVSVITRGYLGFSLFFVVMITGMLPKRWDLTRRLFKVRGFFSKIGFIVMLPHILYHVLNQFIDIYGLIMAIVMVPLFLFSIDSFKRLLKPEDWHTMFKLSYIVYGLMFLHVLSVSSVYSQIVYVALFVLYLNNKIIKEVIYGRKRKSVV